MDDVYGKRADQIIVDDRPESKEEALARTGYAEAEFKALAQAADEIEDDTSTSGNNPEPRRKSRRERRAEQAEERRRLKRLKTEAKRLGLSLDDVTGVDSS